jgi:Tfp pilus assembly protein PilF
MLPSLLDRFRCKMANPGRLELGNPTRTALATCRPNRSVALLSIALFLSACQTLNDNPPASEKDDAATSLSMARAFLDAGRPDKAMYELRLSIEKNTSDPMAHSLMGLSQLALKNPRKAVESLETAWKLDHKAQYALNLSSAYIENRQPESAQKIIKEGLALKETPPYRNKERFYHNLGLLAEMKGSLVAAEKAYSKALEENPTFYLSRAKIAVLLEERHKIEAAKDHWEIARMSCPGCFEAILHLARYYQNKGDTKTALGLVQDYRRIEGINPTESKKAAELESEISGTPSKISVKPTSHTNR